MIVIAIIVLNLLMWVLAQGAGAEPALSRSICLYGLIPGELLGRLRLGTPVYVGPDVDCTVGGPTWATVFTSMFMHGGWFHIIGNLWFLWVFGDNVEDAVGHGRFIFLYLISGVAAAAVQVAVGPSSAIPMVGASGAIGGVMGAYAVRYPRARVQMLVIVGFFVRTMWVPARVMLGYWFLLQILGGLPALARVDGGVAFWAHIGGFIAGAALLFLLGGSTRAAESTAW